MSGENSSACCCGQGSCDPGILITTYLEAAVQVMFSYKFERYGIWGTTKGVCPLETECAGNFWKNALEWTCGLTAIIHDDIADLTRIKVPTSAYCFDCGLQNVGNCGCGEAPAGSNACCGPACNQAGQYTGHTCKRPGGYFLPELGGCSCGCSGYGPQGPIACHDTSNVIQTYCNWVCNEPLMFKYYEGPEFYYPGGFSWQTNSHYVRSGQYCFPLASTFDDTDDILISMPTCAGGAGGTTIGSMEPVSFTVSRYQAPPAGFDGGISGKSDCGCYCCKPQLPGPAVGIGDYIDYIRNPVWACDYGVTLTLTSATGPCAGNWTVDCNGNNISIYLNGILQGTITLLQTSANLNTAVLAATGGCVQVSNVNGCPTSACPRKPQNMCVGPAAAFAATPITAIGNVCGTSIYKTGMEAGTAVPAGWVGTSNPTDLRPRYKGNAAVFTGTVLHDPAGMTELEFSGGFEVELDNIPCFTLDASAVGAGICSFPPHPLIGYMPDEGIWPVLNSNGTVNCHCWTTCPQYTGEPPNNGYDIVFNTSLFAFTTLRVIGSGIINTYEYSDYGCCDARPACSPGLNLDCANGSRESVPFGCSDCDNPDTCGTCGCLIDPAFSVPPTFCECANCCIPRHPVYLEQQRGNCREDLGNDKTTFHGGIKYQWWLRRNA
jgi:hypothetical protein